MDTTQTCMYIHVYTNICESGLSSKVYACHVLGLEIRSDKCYSCTGLENGKPIEPHSYSSPDRELLILCASLIMMLFVHFKLLHGFCKLLEHLSLHTCEGMTVK